MPLILKTSHHDEELFKPQERMVSKALHHDEELFKPQERMISKMVHYSKSTEKFKLFPFFTTDIQWFPLYIFITFIIIIVLFRRRYCKGKGKPHRV